MKTTTSSTELLNHQIKTGEDILDRRAKEEERHVHFPAFSRVELETPHGKQVCWLVERFCSGLTYRRTWTGTVVGAKVASEALDDGNVVSKNAPFGLILDQYGEKIGTRLPLDGGLRSPSWATQAIVVGFTDYVPRQSDATNGTMRTRTITDPVYFASLKELVADLKTEVVPHETIPDRSGEFREIVDQLKEEQRRIAELRRAQRERIRHVVASAALRNQPKLDSRQIQVKQLRILNGHLIIEGAPGTGKTTALLDRINLLTDPDAIREHVPTLSDDAVRRLADPHSGYRLFTPTNLFRHYLKEAMNAKGLLADQAKLTTWEAYRDRLAHQLGFLSADPRTSRFLKNRRAFASSAMTFDVRALEWSAFFNVLRETFSDFVLRRHNRVQRLDPDATSNPQLVCRVQQRLRPPLVTRRGLDLIDLFRWLYDLGNDATNEARREAKDRLSPLATRLHARIRNDDGVYARVSAALANLRLGSIDDGDAGEPGDADVISGIPGNFGSDEQMLVTMEHLARSVLRKLALQRGLRGVRFTPGERVILNNVKPWLGELPIDALAPGLLTSLLRSPCAGPDRNVVSQAASFFLWLRRTHFAGRLSGFLHADVRQRIATSGPIMGKEIGPDELDMVLLIQLWLLRVGRDWAPSRGAARSREVTVYQDSLREVVAVDEATDFSPVQLACMAMSSNPTYDCVTLVGDLMQRMTPFGLQDWGEYESVAGEVGLGPTHRVGLGVSYRQSHRLLSVTNRLYDATVGGSAPTESPYPPSEHDPHPLHYFGADLNDCADWVAERIVEVRRSYDEQGVMPTIAVLVPDERTVDAIADALEDATSLGPNVEVERCRDGKVLGDSASVRVFNVEHIKGLEFEAAFFLDIGAIADRFPSLVERLLYVGLSRASLYLGITSIGHSSSVLDPILDDLKDGNWSA